MALMPVSNFIQRVFVSTQSTPNSVRRYLKSLLLVALVTGIGFLLNLRVAATNVAMLYLATVVFIALKWGFRPAVLSSIISAFLFDYLFIPPYMSFTITDVWYFITLVVMVGIGILTSLLAGAARKQMMSAREREAETAVLYSMTQRLAAAGSTDQILPATASHIQETFGRPVAILLGDESNQLLLRYQTPGSGVDEDTLRVARSLFRDSLLAPTRRREGLFVPLKIGPQVIGMIVLLPSTPQPSMVEARERVLVGAADQVALAIRRASLEARAREADRLEREQARSRVAKAEAIAVLAGGLAHNLNNILTAALGNISLAVDTLGEYHPVSSWLRNAASSTERAAALVAQILAYAGKSRFFDADVNLSQAVREFIQEIGASIPSNIQVRTYAANDLPIIKADRNQVRQLIRNLFLNAIEAIGGSEGTVTIETGVEAVGRSSEESTQKIPPGEYVCLRIGDTGSGIDEETRPKIFDPFFTTKFVGRGLGLAAADGIMRAHGGTIRVSSQPGRGSTFTCLFPVTPKIPV
jgi:K+-sensing histidine kinase KdpD